MKRPNSAATTDAAARTASSADLRPGRWLPAETSTDYHTAVVARLDQRTVDDFFRLFMLAGIAHCGGGPGSDTILHSSDAENIPLEVGRDVLLTLQDWVENGHAPAHLIASKLNDKDTVERTRLVCAEPRTARYKGSGNPLDAATWKCTPAAH